jgi:hypothetical protein
MSAPGRGVETVSKCYVKDKSCYSGWPGGHCLRVLKEQEAPTSRPQALVKPLSENVAGLMPLVASRPGRMTSGPPTPEKLIDDGTISVFMWILRRLPWVCSYGIMVGAGVSAGCTRFLSPVERELV